MTSIRIGGVVSTLDALGPAPRSDWVGSPKAHNDFATRYQEDLALLAAMDVRSVRLGFDWARLEPRPGEIDDDWREWYQHVLDAAAASDVAIWATLHEATVPRWFDDAGSFADERAAGHFWPRWVERCAELFGDRVAGWFPIHDPVRAAGPWLADPARHEQALIDLAVAWRDAWRILRGGPPVATSLRVQMVRVADHDVPAQQAARLDDHLRWRMWLGALRDGTLRLPSGRERAIADLDGALDVVGLATALDHPETELSDESLRRWEERLGTIVRRAAEDGPERPVVLSGLRISWPNDAERTLLVEAARRALDTAVGDGVQLETVYVDPAIGAPEDSALADRDREPACAAWTI